MSRKKQATMPAVTGDPPTRTSAEVVGDAHDALDNYDVEKDDDLCRRIVWLGRKCRGAESEASDLQDELDDEKREAEERGPDLLTSEAEHTLKRWRQHHEAYGDAVLLEALREEPAVGLD